MSVPDSPASVSPALSSSKAILVQPPPTFPGFALPEAALHSIPLPPEFNELVRSAFEENRVRTIFPKFFNPLFRRQGVVNKHALHALESVGSSLAQLAREIENRDRVLEMLTAHLNAYGEHMQQRQHGLTRYAHQLTDQLEKFAENLQQRDEREDVLDRYTKQLGQQIQEVSDNLQTQQERDAAQALTRTKILTAATKAAYDRLNQLQVRQKEFSEQLGSLDEATHRHDAKIKEQDHDLAQNKRVTTDGLAELETAIATLREELVEDRTDTRAREESLWATLQATCSEQKKDRARLDSLRQDLLSSLDQSTQQHESSMLEQENRLTQHEKSAAADLAAVRAELLPFHVEFESKLAKHNEVLAEERATASAREEALMARLRATSGEQNEIRTQVEILRLDLLSLAETTTTLNKRQQQLDESKSTREDQLQQSLDTLATRLTALESTLMQKVDSIKSKKEEQIESALSSLRAANAGHQSLVSRLDDLNCDLLSLAEANIQNTRRQESAESTLGAATVSWTSILPSLIKQLEVLAASTTPDERRLFAEQAAATTRTAETTTADGFYAALEARFRGPRALIRERQTHYLPIIEEARSRVETFPPELRSIEGGHPLDQLYAGSGVLDLGCGRGEWLELIKEKSMPALGVEMNQFFLQTCRQRGVGVIEANLVDFLATAPANSVAVVTGFHVIEHLPFPVLQETLRNCFRILRRGGVAIFETPNPGNILTSALNFRIDPTHQHPVHPALGQLLLENAGFSGVRLEYLHPYDPSHLVGEKGDPLADRFNAYFYGPQDYAVIGVKP